MKSSPSRCLYFLAIFLTLSHLAACGGTTTDPSNNLMADPQSESLIEAVQNNGGIGIDYDPSVRCSDTGTVAGSVACMPQLSFADCGDPSSEDNLSGCPDRCQHCYDQDLTDMQSNLGVNHLTNYQANYYLVRAAQKVGMGVLLGTCDDFIVTLATDASQNDCTICGAASMCGVNAANSFVNGACRGTTPWDPTQFCESKCISGAPCTNADCSCTGNADCGGAAGSCDMRGYYPPFKEFMSDGTVLGIQLGNEVLSANVDGQPLTKAQVVKAAGVMRQALNDPSNGLSSVPIVISLRVGNEQNFCENGAPPKNVDHIAAHPYCNDVASVPPMWPLETGNTDDQAATDCVNQVFKLYNDNAVKYCGAANVFIGETGYNTGCPMVAGESTHLAVAPLFVEKAIAKACTDSIPLFLFEHADVCPEGGCLPGCPSEPNLGNGYFGIYHTENYGTKGSLVLKYPSAPTLSCQ